MNLFYQPDLAKGATRLNEEESRHAVRVLRLKPGDTFVATDGAGIMYDCRITSVSGPGCEFEVTGRKSHKRDNYSIHLAVAPTKNQDRIEWLVEKATEIGVGSITFVYCERSERDRVNIDRITRVAVSAMKQSLQPWMPAIHDVQPFHQIISGNTAQKFIAHLGTTTNQLKSVAHPGESYLVLIGPEGDFTDAELSAATSSGFVTVALGSKRLRTETAALVACHTLALINQ